MLNIAPVPGTMATSPTTTCLLLLLLLSSCCCQVWGGRSPSSLKGDREDQDYWLDREDLPNPVHTARKPKLDPGEMISAIDVSGDVDHKPDNNGEFTSGYITKPGMPADWTFCGAFRVKAWNGKAQTTGLVQLNKENDRMWMYFYLAGSNFGEPFVSETRFYGRAGLAYFDLKTPTVWFPHEWLRICMALNTVTGRVTIVSNGEVLTDQIYQTALEPDADRPTTLKMQVGAEYDGYEIPTEHTGQYSNLNMFSTPLATARMVAMTLAGGEECGAPGDLLSWQEEMGDWKMLSQAKMVQMVGELEGPCRRESKINIFTAVFEDQNDCMQHCKKMGNGRAPPVRTAQELKFLQDEVLAITPDKSVLPWTWVSATDEEEEFVWRDSYTGEVTDYVAFPWYPGHDGRFGRDENCIIWYIELPFDIGWGEKACAAPRTKVWACPCHHHHHYHHHNHHHHHHHQVWACPCQYDQQPVLRLRGLCGGADSIVDRSYRSRQLASNPNDLFLLGDAKTIIQYNDSSSKWILTDARSSVTAVSLSSKLSYVLGRHEWEVTGDVYLCNAGRPYRTLLKLSGCSKGEFTCNDGQCVTMEQRCDQIPNCRDASDEVDCRLLKLNNNYNKKVPPIIPGGGDGFIKTQVDISIVLLKIVSMAEVQHKIDFKFTIILEWKENRASYQNLKKKTSLNALTDDEIKLLWLPYVVYANTDMAEAVQLGDGLKTTIVVSREGDFTRSGLEVIDETDYFQGAENKLSMYQTYTKEFQCQYNLQRYPFDTQVR